jgi:hypothetical protein
MNTLREILLLLGSNGILIFTLIVVYFLGFANGALRLTSRYRGGVEATLQIVAVIIFILLVFGYRYDLINLLKSCAS